mmetsp:Transcript_16854/g.34578  ORF Transcript_16854/g.34578 Transcript_16854/m.34578 type:complete len:203 (-) Transcript_16854:126-734(-)
MRVGRRAGMVSYPHLSFLCLFSSCFSLITCLCIFSVAFTLEVVFLLPLDLVPAVRGRVDLGLDPEAPDPQSVAYVPDGPPGPEHQSHGVQDARHLQQEKRSLFRQVGIESRPKAQSQKREHVELDGGVGHLGHGEYDHLLGDGTEEQPRGDGDVAGVVAQVGHRQKEGGDSDQEGGKELGDGTESNLGVLDLGEDSGEGTDD